MHFISYETYLNNFCNTLNNVIIDKCIIHKFNNIIIIN